MRKHPWVTSILCILLAFTGWVGYELYRSYHWPVVNTFTMESDKLHRDYKIVILADMHGQMFEGLEEQVAELNPDFILLAGDMVDGDKENTEEVLAVVQKLMQISDVYYAYGNHELLRAKTEPDLYEKLEKTGVYILDGIQYDIGDDIRLGGLYDYPFGWDKGGYNTADSAPEKVQTYLQNFVDTTRFTLFAAHRPDSFYYSDASEVYPIDLVVSGHIHGGQVVLPFKGGLYGGDQGWFPKYCHGMYTKNKIHMLVTSGLGTGDEKLPRFNNPPEICVLELKGKQYGSENTGNN